MLQTLASGEHGYWNAGSTEFLQTGTMEFLRWLRVVGDTIFAAGIVSLVVFVFELSTGWSIRRAPARDGLRPNA